MNKTATSRSPRNPGHDVVIVGAGVIGLACAWRLRQRGLSVAVLESDQAGAKTSHVAAGMLAPVTEVEFGEAALMNLNLASARIYPEFAAELTDATGAELDYRQDGSLYVAADRDDASDVERLYELQRSTGLDVERLDGRSCRRLEPGLAPSLVGGLLARSDAQIDPRSLTAALLKAVQNAGVTVAEHTTVAETVISGGRCVGVKTRNGRLWPADEVVAATGCWSGQDGWIPEFVRPPVRPVKGQLLRLRTRTGERFCEHIIRTPWVYVVSRADGRVVVGASVEEQGFDRSITAGAVLELLREGYRILPDLAELELVETQAGLRPGTPDNAPILGHTRLPGLTFATGHYRNGVLLTPITAQIVTAVLTGDSNGLAEEIPIDDFSAARFDHALEAAG
ncbi:MAG: glycine oxidase ThiO [Thermoleophilia bacterium]|nr:glycine oxidase ThiO [Thermoleophilia bacterium]